MNRLKSQTFGFLAFTTILITLNFSISPSQAQPSPENGDPIAGGEGKMSCPMECEPWPEKLALTDEQMEKLVELKSDYEVKTAEKEAQIMANGKKMALLMTAANTDKEAIMSLSERTNSLKAELSKARINKMLDAMAIMTPQQKEQIHHHMLEHMLTHHQMGHVFHHALMHHSSMHHH